MTTTTKQNIGIGTTYEISQKFSTFLFEEKYKYSICSSNILGGNIMKKNSPYRKGVVITIIVLFTSLFIIPTITGNIKDRDLQQQYDRLTNAYTDIDGDGRNGFDIANCYYVNPYPDIEPMLWWNFWRDFPGR